MEVPVISVASFLDLHARSADARFGDRCPVVLFSYSLPRVYSQSLELSDGDLMKTEGGKGHSGDTSDLNRFRENYAFAFSKSGS